MAEITPEQAVKQAADRFSRRFVWAAITVFAIGWGFAAAAIAAASWQLAGFAVLMLVPTAGCALAAFAFQSSRMRRDTTEQLKQKLKS